jgi:hypothetical protein
LGLALGVVLTAPSARADTPELETIRLVYDAPAACPNVDRFLGEVRRAASRLRVTSGDESVRLFTVRLQMEGGPRGRLSIAENGAIIGARDVQGKTCDDVASVLAFAVALAVDPNAAAPPPAPAPSEERRPISPAPSPEMAPASTPTWWGLSARALAADGLAPNPMLGGGVSVDLGGRAGAWAPAARFGLEYASSAPAPHDGGNVHFSDAFLSLEGCPTAWDFGALTLRPCARVDGGLRMTEGEGIPGARRVVRPWFALGAMVHLRDRVVGPFFVDLAGGALFALVRDQVFSYPDAPEAVHRVPLVSGRGELALGFEFR